MPQGHSHLTLIAGNRWLGWVFVGHRGWHWMPRPFTCLIPRVSLREFTGVIGVSFVLGWVSFCPLGVALQVASLVFISFAFSFVLCFVFFASSVGSLGVTLFVVSIIFLCLPVSSFFLLSLSFFPFFHVSLFIVGRLRWFWFFPHVSGFSVIRFRV